MTHIFFTIQKNKICDDTFLEIPKKKRNISKLLQGNLKLFISESYI